MPCLTGVTQHTGGGLYRIRTRVSQCGGKSGDMIAIVIDKLAFPEQQSEDPYLLGSAYKQHA